MLLHDLRAGYESKSFFLELLLGLYRGTQRLEAALEAEGLTPPPSLPDPEAMEGEPPPSDLVLLGLISLSRTVRRHLDALAAEAGPEPQVEEAPPGSLFY